MKKIGIIDLPASNSRGIQSALARLGQNSEISNEIENLEGCSSLVLPGVGRFGPASSFLRDSGLAEFVAKAYLRGTPILGICLGFQLLFQSSEESPGFDGLNLIPGEVLKLRHADAQKVPNIGWRAISSSGEAFGESLTKESLLYFAHSYEVKGEFPSNSISTARFGNYEFLAALRIGNLWGAQFHPEKSHDSGLEFLAGFAEVVR